MSRRTRRRNGNGEKRWLGKVVVGLLILAVVSVGVGYAMVRNYLHSDAFRKFLSAEASKIAGVTGEFAPFRWQGLAVDTDSFEATGEGLVSNVRADGLHTEIGLGGVGRGVWEIRESSVKRLDVSIDARKRMDEEAVAKEERKSEKPSARPGWFPRDAELQGMDVGRFSVKALLEEGLVSATDMKFSAERTGGNGAYRAKIDGGSVKLPFAVVPELRLDHVKTRYQDGQIFLTDALVHAWEDGRIEGSGECDMNTRDFSMQGSVTGIHTEEVFGPDWAKRLTGDVVSDFTLSNPSGSPQAHGTLTIDNAVVTALPLLDTLAAYADTRRFRVLTLQEARTDWRWKKGELSITKLVLSSEGLVRLEGSMTIRGREIDGLFRLGLAPGTLATIPGAETLVFIAGERGLLWAPLRITGTLDDPKEDLSDRLMTAAGLRMFDQIPETGEKVIKFTQSMLGEAPGKSVETGTKILREGTKAVRDVTGILGGLLGGEELKQDDEEK